MASSPFATAAWLAQEHAESRRFVPFAAARGIVSLADAYAVQRSYVELCRDARKAAVAGYKIGLTSPTMQAMCRIAHPVSGMVLQDGVHCSGIGLDRTGYGRLGLEFELAVRLRHDLQGTGDLAMADVERAVEAGQKLRGSPSRCSATYE